MAHNRMDKINELIFQQLSKIIQPFVEDKIVSISSVDTSKDLSYCDITVMVLHDDQTTVELLNKKSGLFRTEIARSTILRKVPLLRFHLDQTEAYADKIDNLLKKI